MTKRRSLIRRWFSRLRTQSKRQEPLEIPRWVDYRATEDNLVPAVRDLTSYLVTRHYSSESQYADEIVDQLLEEYGPRPMANTEGQKVVGLGLGTMADLGTIEAFRFAALVMLEVADRASATTETIAEVLRELPDQLAVYENLRSRAEKELGVDRKTAQRLLDTVLDVVDPQFRFVLGNAVPMEEHRYCEFKGVESKQPVNKIKGDIAKYAVAFLNRGGGRIYFGIDDKSRKVQGVKLVSHQRDDLRKRVGGKMRELDSPVAPEDYRINFHPVVNDDDEEIPNLFVVEVIVPLALDRSETRTESGTKYVRSDRGNERISDDQEE